MRTPGPDHHTGVGRADEARRTTGADPHEMATTIRKRRDSEAARRTGDRRGAGANQRAGTAGPGAGGTEPYGSGHEAVVTMHVPAPGDRSTIGRLRGGPPAGDGWEGRERP